MSTTSTTSGMTSDIDEEVEDVFRPPVYLKNGVRTLTPFIFKAWHFALQFTVLGAFGGGGGGGAWRQTILAANLPHLRPPITWWAVAEARGPGRGTEVLGAPPPLPPPTPNLGIIH